MGFFLQLSFMNEMYLEFCNRSGTAWQVSVGHTCDISPTLTPFVGSPLLEPMSHFFPSQYSCESNSVIEVLVVVLYDIIFSHIPICTPQRYQSLASLSLSFFFLLFTLLNSCKHIWILICIHSNLSHLYSYLRGNFHKLVLCWHLFYVRYDSTIFIFRCR